MKKCNKCGLEKPLGEFSVNKIKKDGLQANCRECGKIRNKEWYKKNRSHKLAYTLDRKKENRPILWQRIQPLFDMGCQMCGENDIATLEFHHVEKRQFIIANDALRLSNDGVCGIWALRRLVRPKKRVRFPSDTLSSQSSASHSMPAYRSYLTYLAASLPCSSV